MRADEAGFAGWDSRADEPCVLTDQGTGGELILANNASYTGQNKRLVMNGGISSAKWACMATDGNQAAWASWLRL